MFILINPGANILSLSTLSVTPTPIPGTWYSPWIVPRDGTFASPWYAQGASRLAYRIGDVELRFRGDFGEVMFSACYVLLVLYFLVSCIVNLVKFMIKSMKLIQ